MVGTQIHSLTSLRFFAAAMIVLGHGGSKSFFSYSIDLIDLRQAVTFFFVLSGFILNHAYRNFDFSNGRRSFFSARFSRLYPAYIITALVPLIFLTPPTGAIDVLKYVMNLLMLQSWVPLANWYYTLNAVSWSISTEMFFYVAFPFALPFVQRSPAKAVLVSVLIVAFTVLLASAAGASPVESAPGVTAWGILYISPVTRFAEFLFGMAAYEFALRIKSRAAVWSRTTASVLEALSVVLALVFMALCTWLAKSVLVATYPQASVWVQTSGPFMVFGLLLAIMSCERGVISYVLNYKVLVLLGEVSFALYMVHQLTIRIMFAYYGDFLKHNLTVGYVAYWVISIGLAFAVYFFVEKPLRMPIRRALDKRVSRLA